MHTRTPQSSSPRTGRLFAGIMTMLAAASLAGCGGGAETVALPPAPGGGPGGSNYNGPPPATADVQSFRINLWENIRTNSRCGGCHMEGGQAPTFARSDDVNMAYSDANPVADLMSPADSRLVTKVGGGHNCWLTDAGACADIMTTWIENWAGDTVAGGGREIDLKAPVLKDPGTSKNFPADPSLFASTVHPLLTLYCSNCHVSASAAAQQPFFASTDVQEAYDAVKTKIDLDDPANSRLVVRLRNEFHNCWDNCVSNATEMETQILAMAGQIQPTQVDPTLTVSKALTLFDGTIASGGNRYEANQIALWEFKSGAGSTAFDTSGVDPAINLTLSGDVEWFGGWGINVKSGKAQGSTTASRKLHDMIKATGEYSIEGWVVPGNVTQEEARIVSYSAGTMARNFTLQQTLYDYNYQNRSDNTDGNGDPDVSTPAADEVLQATLQHVVTTFDPVEGRKIYVNGQLIVAADPAAGGTVADWDDTFAVVLGNEVSSDRQWVGVLRMVAIHNRVLTPAQIVQNFDVGVGEKFFLLFSLGHLINVPESYVVFEVSQFDSYAYLFNTPFFISLDATATPDAIPVQGMRIGINGAEAEGGQTYANMDTAISSAIYSAATGQSLSGLGAVVPLEKGPASDEFFLTFEVLGPNTNVRTEPTPLIPAPPPDGTPAPALGLRVFNEINATMSQMTTVSTQHPDVQTTYTTVEQQLPTVENIEAFLSAHQVAVSQLAIEYCNALVEDNGLRSSYWPGVNFGASAVDAFDTTAERDLVLDPLLDRVLNTGVGTQPAAVNVKGELNNLIDRLTACGGSCAADRTEIVVKSVCAGAVGSAAMLLQ